MPRSDEEDEDVEDRVTFLRLGLHHPPEKNKSHENVDGIPCVLVVRCTLALQEANDDWRRTVIFHTYWKCSDKNCKVIINDGSCTNVVSSKVVSHLVVSPEPHPQPY